MNKDLQKKIKKITTSEPTSRENASESIWLRQSIIMFGKTYQSKYKYTMPPREWYMCPYPDYNNVEKVW